MQSVSAESVALVIGLMISTVGFIALVFGINKLLSPRNPGHEKNEPYECGLDQIGAPRVPVRLRFAKLLPPTFGLGRLPHTRQSGCLKEPSYHETQIMIKTFSKRQI